MRAALVMLVVAGCSSSEQPRGPIESKPKPRDPMTADDAWSAPTAGAFAIPASWAACTKNEDCTVGSMGCCDTTPVNRAHHDRLVHELEAAGRQWCPPKTACGPGAGGTWDGEAGTCAANACVMPPWPK